MSRVAEDETAFVEDREISIGATMDRATVLNRRACKYNVRRNTEATGIPAKGVRTDARATLSRTGRERRQNRAQHRDLPLKKQ